uniref:EF-hand domain-containing protein n=1 Tax=Trichobilharzia regenti TaxID=157069 RepID=A0AA85ITH0_TRIRE|nr:unnamed protein product [Trichobilharzia regenti]
MVARTTYHTTINTTNTSINDNNNNKPYQQPLSYFAPNPSHFKQQWRSYQNLGNILPLNRHVSDQCINGVVMSGSCRNLAKKRCDITILINNDDMNNNSNNNCNYSNNTNHNSSNYSINSTNNNFTERSDRPILSSNAMLENTQNKQFVFRGNSSTMPRLLVYNEKLLRSASLPPGFSSPPIGAGNYLTSKRSIIANTGHASPLLVNSMCYSPSYGSPTYACQHDGADWEDCRISIDCFGFKATRYCAETDRTNWISPVDLNTCRTTLRNCWRKSLIQRMAFKIDDFTIQEDQVKVAKDVFKRFDKRGQEKISTTDLGPAFRALNLTVKPDTLKEWADQVDDDATGFIDFNGFLICYGKKLQEDQDERDLRDAFRVLDKNKRGEIDVEDLRWILKGLGDDLTEEEIDDMIRDTDTDGSGFVDFDEFYKLMTSE